MAALQQQPQRDLLLKEGGEDAADFEPCSQFEGPRQGWFFGTSDKGTGYHRDVGLRQKQAAAKAAAAGKPLVLKAGGSIVKNLPRRPAAAAAAQPNKKQKTDAASTGPGASYLKQMAAYEAMSCGSDTKHDRPLVK